MSETKNTGTLDLINSIFPSWKGQIEILFDKKYKKNTNQVT